MTYQWAVYAPENGLAILDYWIACRVVNKTGVARIKNSDCISLCP
jgi:hypothetical protein